VASQLAQPRLEPLQRLYLLAGRRSDKINYFARLFDTRLRV
jgi:hypothetical protein